MAAPVSVEMLQRVCDLTDRTMSRVDDKQLGDPTPCSDWTVQELTEHIVASTDFFADAAERGEVAEDREWPDYTPSELLAAYRHHATRLLTAFHATGVMDRPMRVAAGPSTPEFFLQPPWPLRGRRVGEKMGVGLPADAVSSLAFETAVQPGAGAPS